MLRTCVWEVVTSTKTSVRRPAPDAPTVEPRGVGADGCACAGCKGDLRTIACRVCGRGMEAYVVGRRA